jgi:hypothetical protein
MKCADRREHFLIEDYYPENTGGSSHVRDCQLWAEIDYLDSPTDYREYLPGQSTSPDMSGRSELVMLETQNHGSIKTTTRLPIVVMGIITMLIIVVLCGCFLRLFLDVF